MSNMGLIDFILEKNYLSSDSLVGAMIRYQASQRPLLKIVHEKKIFSANEMLEILRFQQVKNIGIIEASHSLGGSIQLKLDKFLKENNSMPDFLEYMLTDKTLSTEMLSKVLDEYLSVQASLLKEEESDSEENWQELSRVFDDKFYNKLKVNLSLWMELDSSKDQALILKMLKEYVSEFNKLKVIYNKNNLILELELMNLVEKKILDFIRTKSFENISLRQKCALTLKDTLECLYKMKNELLRSNSKSLYLQNKELKSFYDNNKLKIEGLEY